MLLGVYKHRATNQHVYVSRSLSLDLMISCSWIGSIHTPDLQTSDIHTYEVPTLCMYSYHNYTPVLPKGVLLHKQ